MNLLKIFHQGTKIVAEGRIQTGSYQDKDGKTVYTTEVVVENQEFAESKKAAEEQGSNVKEQPPKAETDENGFMNIPDGVDEELPFM
mgnify:CR=1 FL=1